MRILLIIVFVTLLFVEAYAQEGKKCPTVHESQIAIFVEPTAEERLAIGVKPKVLS